MPYIRKTGAMFRITKINGEVIPKNIYVKMLNVSKFEDNYEIGLFSYDTGNLEKTLSVNKEFFSTLESEGSLVDFFTLQEFEEFYYTPTPRNFRLNTID